MELTVANKGERSLRERQMERGDGVKSADQVHHDMDECFLNNGSNDRFNSHHCAVHYVVTVNGCTTRSTMRGPSVRAWNPFSEWDEGRF